MNSTCNSQWTTKLKSFQGPNSQAKDIYNSQMNYLTQLKPCSLKPKSFYGNQALSMQDPYNPITYFLYQQPK